MSAPTPAPGHRPHAAATGEFLVRAARACEAGEICTVHVASIRALCTEHYSAEQLEAWAAAKKPSLYKRAIEDHVFLVAERRGRIIGFGELNPRTGELCALYVAPEASGRGIGRRLLFELEAAALAAGHEETWLGGSLNAVDFYRHCGYVEEGITELRLAGAVHLGCCRLRKRLVTHLAEAS